MPRTSATVRYTFGLQGTSSNNRADSNEPAFLRRLRAKHGGGDSDRHERPLARPRKQVKDGEDDQPTYVVEGSQDTLSKAEYEALMGTANDEKQDENEPASSPQPDLGADKSARGGNEVSENVVPAKQKTAAIGGSNKRRLAKVVGEDGDDDGEPNVEEKGPAPTGKKPKAKKGKKVKLSFDEEALEP